MSRFRFGLTLLTLVFGSTVAAHEIKVLASQLHVAKPGGKTTIYLSWGHRLPVDELIDPASLERYDLIAPDGTATPLKKEGISLQTNVVELKDAGVYQVLVARKPATFTIVRDEDGNRQMKRGPKTTAKGGTIDYAMHSRQFAKALLVAGPATREPVKPVGAGLEIVPLDGPGDWKAGTAVRFRVLLDGKPVPATELLARYVGFKPEEAWCYATSTDRDGVATVHPSQGGTWVLKVNLKKLTDGPIREQYDYESYTATLALEVSP